MLYLLYHILYACFSGQFDWFNLKFLSIFYTAPQGEKQSSHRLLRSVKNRFGSTDEVLTVLVPYILLIYESIASSHVHCALLGSLHTSCVCGPRPFLC